MSKDLIIGSCSLAIYGRPMYLNAQVHLASFTICSRAFTMLLGQWNRAAVAAFAAFLLVSSAYLSAQRHSVNGNLRLRHVNARRLCVTGNIHRAQLLNERSQAARPKLPLTIVTGLAVVPKELVLKLESLAAIWRFCFRLYCCC